MKVRHLAPVALAMVLSQAALAAKREITVSVIGLPRPALPVAEASVEKAAKYWMDAMDREIGNKPDLVVLPECCDTVPVKSPTEKARWLRMRGSKVQEAIQAYAAAHSCYIAYAAHRVRHDGRFANSITLIDRKGAVVAVYDKVFPTVGESDCPECPIVPGTEAVVAETDFGRIGFVICFDLNFRELREMYARKNPDILLFSSFFDGDFMQRQWALECQSYLISSTCSVNLPGRVIDPSGGELRNENYYMPTFTARINTNCRVIHLDENRKKFAALIGKYGQRVTIRNPGGVGSVTLLSNDPSLPVDDVMEDFKFEPLTDYLNRSRRKREAAIADADRGK